MWNITDFPLVRLCTPSFWSRYFIHSSNIYCPRQRRWIIDKIDPLVHDLDRETCIPYPKMRNTAVRCVLFRKTKKVENNSLLLHIHGGGFISQSPESHDVYLINWVKTLKSNFIYFFFQCIDICHQIITIHLYRYNNFKH